MKTLELIKKLRADARYAKKRFSSDLANRKLFRNKEEKPGEFKDKTFLYIRAIVGDIGARPLPPETAYWNSPDIELYDSSGILISTNELKQDQNHVITVGVYNDGDMTCNSCIVELFICNPSIGLDVSHTTQIGIQTIGINGHSNVIARFEFSPDADNTGHRCLFARAYSYVSGDLPISANQFLVSEDRHIGQQNLSIIPQETSYDFNVIPKLKDNVGAFTLNIKRRMFTLSKYKLPALANFVTVKKAIANENFVFKKIIAPEPKKIVADKIGFKKVIPEKKIIEVPHAKNVELINKVSKYVWKHDFTKGLNKVTLDIPNLGLAKNEAAIYEIEISNDKTRQRIGGITIIITA